MEKVIKSAFDKIRIIFLSILSLAMMILAMICPFLFQYSAWYALLFLLFPIGVFIGEISKHYMDKDLAENYEYP